MDLTLYQVDAFTDRLFAGNPAGVVPSDAWIDDGAMQNIAMENNLAETAFFVPLPDDPKHDFHLRWFTPAIEVDLCGHATLASAAVLYRQLDWAHDEIRFLSRSGTLVVRKRQDMLELDFPAAPPAAADMPAGLADAIGVQPVWFGRAGMNIAMVTDESTLRALDPDMGFIAGMQGDGLIVTAPGDDSDCASRYFAPHAGIPEDPVTGSAHCLIAPFWAGRLGKKEIAARQVSARGGDLWCTWVDDRVLIAGQAVLYMTATITL